MTGGHDYFEKRWTSLFPKVCMGIFSLWGESAHLTRDLARHFCLLENLEEKT